MATSNLYPPFFAGPNVTQSNWLAPPYNRWGFKNAFNFQNVRIMSKGDDPTTYVDLPVSTVDYGLDDFVYEARVDERIEMDNVTGEEYVTGTPYNRTFSEFLNLTYTDSILVMRKGEIVYEKYFDAQTPATRHIMFSVTKSFCGLMASMLANEGLLDPDAMVIDYLPAMASSSALADATVREVMDMSTDYKYSEDYDDPTSEVVAQMVAGGSRTPPEGYDGPMNLREFLVSLEKVSNETHGVKFTYRSSNTDLLGWLIDVVLSDDPDNAKNSASTTYFQEKLWSQLGQGYDAAIFVDPTHFPAWAGGSLMTARDAARYGQMMLNGGLNATGGRVVPKEVVDDIIAGGSELNVEQFAGSAEGAPGMAMDGWAYRNQFWVKPNHIFTHVGIYGQWIWMDTIADMVIVKQSSFPSSTGWIIDDDTVLAFEALGEYFASLPDPDADEDLESTPKQVERSSKIDEASNTMDNSSAGCYSMCAFSATGIVALGGTLFLVAFQI